MHWQKGCIEILSATGLRVVPIVILKPIVLEVMHLTAQSQQELACHEHAERNVGTDSRVCSPGTMTSK